ncbi:IclR family transcriptional regulator [Muricoccus radiodurans]|uniref:IclR family transcriptional regulator n=1 Tax=Muricoccus radiodurans TaxID=2231721 RepID=UPI003CF5F6AD
MRTVEKALRLLRMFSSVEPELGVSELARRLDLDRATVHRLLQALLAQRFVEQDAASRRYRLGLGVLDIAAVRISQHGLLHVAMPHLEHLREATDETVALLVPDGSDAVCIATLESRHAVRVGYNIGERIALHASAGGQVLLANIGAAEREAVLKAGFRRFTRHTVTDRHELEAILDEVRRQRGGWSAEGYIDGVISAAAPIMDPKRRLAAAVSLAAPLPRRNRKDLPKLLEAARQAADGIERAWSGLSPNLPSSRIVEPVTKTD